MCHCEDVLAAHYESSGSYHSRKLCMCHCEDVLTAHYESSGS